jgi:hypothetical protein
MEGKTIETRLIRKQTKISTVCTCCGCKIEPYVTYYLEEGVKEHLHSLLARKFCSNCYARYGEKILLTGKSK